MNFKLYGIVFLVCFLAAASVVVVLGSRTVQADPSNDQGCYCHNNNIQVWINDSGDGEGGMFLGTVAAGATFHIIATTTNKYATGVVPGLQEWFSNESDNAKFTFSPQSVTANSPQNLNTTSGAITALYTVTAPTTGAGYTLTLYGQGTMLEPISVFVSAATTSTSTTTSSTSRSSTSSTTTTSATAATTQTVSMTTTSTTSVTVTQTTTVTLPATTITATAPPSTVTSTATQTAAAPPSTVTSTATQTVTSTAMQTSSVVPGWAYGAMVVLLLVGLAVGYVVKRPRAR